MTALQRGQNSRGSGTATDINRMVTVPDEERQPDPNGRDLNIHFADGSVPNSRSYA
jgi:hypothetical protein